MKFDVAFKHLFEAYPADWLRVAGFDPALPVEIIDADLATISAEADKGITRMKDSSTYQMIVEEGREEGREQGLGPRAGAHRRSPAHPPGPRHEALARAQGIYQATP